MSKLLRFKIGEKLKELRVKKGLTQQQVADLSEVDYKHVQKMEGKTPSDIRIETLEKICKALNVSLSQFLK
ncbi:MAG: transcriptional regulator with XRE-family HTH domain [Candidatus Omnitrophota bacterium]|jgi:transcriptional regulator with XRE-family HTH domain